MDMYTEVNHNIIFKKYKIKIMTIDAATSKCLRRKLVCIR